MEQQGQLERLGILALLVLQVLKALLDSALLAQQAQREPLDLVEARGQQEQLVQLALWVVPDLRAQQDLLVQRVPPALLDKLGPPEQPV